MGKLLVIVSSFLTETKNACSSLSKLWREAVELEPKTLQKHTFAVFFLFVQLGYIADLQLFNF